MGSLLKEQSLGLVVAGSNLRWGPVAIVKKSEYIRIRIRVRILIRITMMPEAHSDSDSDSDNDDAGGTFGFGIEFG